MTPPRLEAFGSGGNANSRRPLVEAGAITSMDYTAGGDLKELIKDLPHHGTALVFAQISLSLKGDLDRQGLTEVIGPDRQFETLRECLAAYEAWLQSCTEWLELTMFQKGHCPAFRLTLSISA